MPTSRALFFAASFGVLAFSGCNCDPGSPVIHKFTATPATFGPDGGTTTIFWDVQNATKLTLDPGAVDLMPVTSATMDIPISASTTFTLTAQNDVNSATATTSVCVAGAASTLTVTSLDSFACHDPYKATWKVTNNGCDTLTVTSLTIQGTVTDGGCAPTAMFSYPPQTAQVPAGQADVTVLDLTGNAFCCTPSNCPTPFQCEERFDFTAETSAGTLTASTTSALNLDGCDVVCLKP